MKPISLLLAGSLLVNATLVVVMIVAVAGDRPAPPARPAPRPTPVPVTATPDARPGSETWATLAAGDYAAQRDRLQAEGFPPALVRAILAAQIRERFAEQRKAIDRAMADQPYWKNPVADPARQAELRALAREEQKAIRDLLGPDSEHGIGANLRRQFPGWPPDKIDQLAALRERYDQQRQDLYTSVGFARTLAPDDREKMAALDKTMRAEIQGMLTPREFDDYELRTSNTANQLRYNLANFEPTEHEFRTLFRLQAAFDDQFASVGGQLTREQARGRGDAQQQLDREIKAALGDVRYAEYQRARDYEYRTTTQLVARLGLPGDTATKLWAVQREVQDRRGELHRTAGSSTDRTALNAQLTALQEEALAKVTPLLGNARAVEAYKQYGGTWIANLVPRPPPTPPRN